MQLSLVVFHCLCVFCSVSMFCFCCCGLFLVVFVLLLIDNLRLAIGSSSPGLYEMLKFVVFSMFHDLNDAFVCLPACDALLKVLHAF